MTQTLRTEEWTHEFSLTPPEEQAAPAPPEGESKEDKALREEVEAQTTPAPEFQATTLVNTLVVSVWEGEVVHVATTGIGGELGLDPRDAEEVVLPGHQQFVWAFPYDKVRERLEAGGWTHASTQEA